MTILFIVFTASFVLHPKSACYSGDFPIFRLPIVPTAHCSDSSMFRHFLFHYKSMSYQYLIHYIGTIVDGKGFFYSCYLGKRNIYIYIQTYMHTYIHTYICIYKIIRVCSATRTSATLRLVLIFCVLHKLEIITAG